MTNTLIIFLLLMNIYTIYCIKKQNNKDVLDVQQEILHQQQQILANIREKQELTRQINELREENEMLKKVKSSDGGFW